MCTVSMVGDFYDDKFRRRDYSEYFKIITTPAIPSPTFVLQPQITVEQFNALKKEVEDMKELLKRAKIYDEQNGEPNCEMENKVDTLKQIAKLLGVDLGEIFK